MKNYELSTASVIDKTPTGEELKDFVRTEEFKDWFGDWEKFPETSSKLVDEKGEPLLVFIGAPSGIREFHGDARRNTGDSTIGWYATKDERYARFYASTVQDPISDQPAPSSVYGVFLNIRSPKIVQTDEKIRTTHVTERPEEFDAYINDALKEIVVFDPSQICIVSERTVNK